MATGEHYITMLLADCITWSFCPPVYMVKDAMEAIYITHHGMRKLSLRLQQHSYSVIKGR